MSKAEKISAFDPNGLASHDGLYGLPFTAEESDIHILPVPWEVTVSYQSGTAAGPEAILEASKQVDLYDPIYPDGWKRGLFLVDAPEGLRESSDALRARAEGYLEALEQDAVSATEEADLAEINAACAKMNEQVEAGISAILQQGKRAVLLGGDHSTPLGAYRAFKKHYGSFGLLHIDAHADLRPAYEGFTYSHASIMYNALEEELAQSLTMVGIRDYCHQEAELMASDTRIHAFYDRDLKRGGFAGETWAQQVAKMVATLPEKVVLSVDIDGLDPALCPNTGTPVPGGFSMEAIIYLVDQVVGSGRTLVGMDLVEVAPGADEWDANVGARLLYALANRLGEV